MNNKELNEHMEKLQAAYEDINMREDDLVCWADKFEQDIVNELGNCIYYAPWNDDWINEDWALDIAGLLDEGHTITATGSFEIGNEGDTVLVICYK